MPRKLKIDEAKFRKKIGSILRFAREAQKMTQGSVAVTVGMTQSRFSKIERGVFMATAAEWFVICRALGISPDIGVGTPQESLTVRDTSKYATKERNTQ